MSASTAWLLALALAAGPREKAPTWLGEELPLPLAVRSPEDLRFKSVAERQYLIFNLLSAGKVAWDRGDFTTAADRWEALLRVEKLPPEIDGAVRPLAIEARRRAGGESAVAPVPPPPPPAQAGPALASVSGRVTGAGSAGPGGAVVWLTRADGKTPKPRAVRGTVLQRGKRFRPRVIAVPVGSTVAFKNEDEIFHNVFSLTRGSDFDLGLYGKDLARDRRFDTAGPVQILCNIHSSMQGWVYVVDSPWYAQAGADGTFRIPRVPPGEYVIHAWHDAASKPAERRLTLGEGGAQVELAVSGDVRPVTTVPDKYGKPRQIQLGY